jgi:macrodomain Ter protein organizer (MatP/YcbG family)
MPDSLDNLISAGTLEPLPSAPGCRQYHIPKLRHRKQTWMGWQDITYLLTVDEQADPGCRYVVESDSDSSGGETLLATDDPDEVEAWIESRMENTAE